MSRRKGKLMLLSNSTSSGELRSIYDCIIDENDNGIVIQYKEGKNQEALSQINISARGITVEENGEIKSTLLFEENKKRKATLVTEYGELDVKIYTNEIDVKKIDNKLTIYVNYDIYYVGKQKENTRLNINCLEKELI